MNDKKLYIKINKNWKDFRLDDKAGKSLNEDSYHSNSVDDFIKKNEKMEQSEYYPTLKLFGEGGDSKHLSVSFDVLRQISKILKKMKL